MIFGMSHGQSRENINIPEDEIMGGSDRGIEEIGAASSQAPAMAIPRAASPLTTSPMSATPTPSQAPSPGDDDPVSVTITVKTTGS
ncbi:uncharacterized protein LOC103395165 [Cynoglossus semilaevis]|uniref:uncharacterized protein LOC103395165 n=1 Tax=Cynoglossus semilaevis TaxID=244447 RepID=UPI000D62A510|nr:uncharacterized protein vsig10l2 [Cynoglossus semilaevis]